LENIPQVPGNRAEVGQSHDARKAVSASLSLLKLNCPFHCKRRHLGVSLVSPRLENIPQVPGNPAKVGQNDDARKAVSATLLVLK